ncbi:MAG: hypothetical protein ACI9O0_001234 [Paracoccaceae bacterium]|jgi:hypothetical protein
MRPLLYLLTFSGVIALAFWAYRENYATQNSIEEAKVLRNEIAHLREALSVQRAEWAYLNRPARLRDLAAMNFNSLGLQPLTSAHFGDPARLAYYEAPASAQAHLSVDMVELQSLDDPTMAGAYKP